MTNPSLTTCEACGKEISKRALNCIHCGHPNKEYEEIRKPVTIERLSKFSGALIKGCVAIDGNIIGTIGNGEVLNTSVALGKHFVSTENNVRHGNSFMPLSTSVNRDGKEFTVSENTKSVHITITTKASWTGSTGSLVVDSVICKN